MKKALKIDIAKQANLFNKIFDYIYMAKCKRLFLLIWYNDETYTSPLTILLIPCCNSPSCNSEDFKYLQQAFFINIVSIKYIETERE